jgi:hypothetical protein
MTYPGAPGIITKLCCDKNITNDGFPTNRVKKRKTPRRRVVPYFVTKNMTANITAAGAVTVTAAPRTAHPPAIDLRKSLLMSFPHFIMDAAYTWSENSIAGSQAGGDANA